MNFVFPVVPRFTLPGPSPTSPGRQKGRESSAAIVIRHPSSIAQPSLHAQSSKPKPAKPNPGWSQQPSRQTTHTTRCSFGLSQQPGRANSPSPPCPFQNLS
ncbi:hypothetical protein BGZ61DRAFT_28336 [Ilyonectria robusta]|uniref:uncharacterized protein n=1 Tax=Ilyonectria robusta TaxID=1079257 RepID=UPI001E8CAA43|nr:uncharacterized protein BGZ61DRAFT_28336 [Ilyonectria robusta]KAH8738122.1 hypothetical protein BGZ61DRAFT_28336 [Ilyonectria robusta]